MFCGGVNNNINDGSVQLIVSVSRISVWACRDADIIIVINSNSFHSLINLATIEKPSLWFGLARLIQGEKHVKLKKRKAGDAQ